MIVEQKDGSWSAFQRIGDKAFLAEGHTRDEAKALLTLLLQEHGITNITAQVGSNEHE